MGQIFYANRTAQANWGSTYFYVGNLQDITYLLSADNSYIFNYNGASYAAAPLLISFTFGTAMPAHTEIISYLDGANSQASLTIYIPAFNTTKTGNSMYFYVAKDGSTYFADVNNNGLASNENLLSSAQALVPAHLARAAPKGSTARILCTENWKSQTCSLSKCSAQYTQTKTCVETGCSHLQTTEQKCCPTGYGYGYGYGSGYGYGCSVPPVSPTCTDGLSNQGETGIDCGGPCPACHNKSVQDNCTGSSAQNNFNCTGKSVQNNYNCTDSDITSLAPDGRNYLVAGNITTGNGSVFSDTCYSDAVLKEFYCLTIYTKAELVTCPNGCAAGVCKGASQTTTSTGSTGSGNTINGLSSGTNGGNTQTHIIAPQPPVAPQGSIINTTPQGPGVTPIDTSSGSGQNVKSTSVWYWIGVIGGILILLAIIVGLILYFLSKRKDSAAVAQ